MDEIVSLFLRRSSYLPPNQCYITAPNMIQGISLPTNAKLEAFYLIRSSTEKNESVVSLRKKWKIYLSQLEDYNPGDSLRTLRMVLKS